MSSELMSIVKELINSGFYLYGDIVKFIAGYYINLGVNNLKNYVFTQKDKVNFLRIVKKVVMWEPVSDEYIEKLERMVKIHPTLSYAIGRQGPELCGKVGDIIWTGMELRKLSNKDPYKLDHVTLYDITNLLEPYNFKLGKFIHDLLYSEEDAFFVGDIVNFIAYYDTSLGVENLKNYVFDKKDEKRFLNCVHRINIHHNSNPFGSNDIFRMMKDIPKSVINSWETSLLENLDDEDIVWNAKKGFCRASVIIDGKRNISFLSVSQKDIEELSKLVVERCALIDSYTDVHSTSSKSNILDTPSTLDTEYLLNKKDIEDEKDTKGESLLVVDMTIIEKIEYFYNRRSTNSSNYHSVYLKTHMNGIGIYCGIDKIEINGDTEKQALNKLYELVSMK